VTSLDYFARKAKGGARIFHEAATVLGSWENVADAGLRAGDAGQAKQQCFR